MKVVFRKLEIKNFRQIADQSFSFSDKSNLILGHNAAGKTNILHAITWCLFGKDLADRTKFEMVPLNPDNTRTELEPDVTLALSIDGDTHELRRELKDGKTTQAYIDGAPCKTLKEFDAFVSEIFDTPERFKMYTNPLFFPESHWQSQRETFMQFFPMPSVENVLAGRTFPELLTTKIKKMDPERVQAATLQEQKDIEVERTKIRNQLELLDEQLESNQTFDDESLVAERDKLREMIKVSREQSQEVIERNSALLREASKLEAEIKTYSDNINRLKANAGAEHIRAIEDKENVLRLLRHKLSGVQELYAAIRVIDLTCPTCGQDLPEEQAEAKNTENIERKTELAAEGTKIANQVKEFEAELATLRQQKVGVDPEVVDELEDKISQARNKLASLPAMQEIPEIDNDMLNRLDELEKALARADVHKENLERREKLMKRERDVGIEFERTEIILKSLAEFFFQRSQMIVKAVNKHFKGISVKVLDIQKNGTAKETFEILKNGVPYSELNTAGQLEAGLELTGFLKRQLGVEAPTLIDNGERYTDVDFSQVDGQLICAIAVKDSPLTIRENITPDQIDRKNIEEE